LYPKKVILLAGERDQALDLDSAEEPQKNPKTANVTRVIGLIMRMNFR
jgi:hypothetical protein